MKWRRIDAPAGARLMPYVFPHEDAFVLGTAALIVVLLIVRVILARRKARRLSPGPQGNSIRSAATTKEGDKP